MKERTLKDFTNKYSLSKTLRFRLEPQGSTLKHITAAQIIETDERRTKDYEQIKGYIDEYHRHFISSALSEMNLKYDSTGHDDSLQDFLAVYLSNEEGRTAQLNKIFDNLRKSIVKAFKSHSQFKHLFKKEMITLLLPSFVKTEQEQHIVTKFKKFTTYFTGFFINRANMYDEGAKSTAIAYRIINQNLVRFTENMLIFQTKIQPTLSPEILKKLYTEFQEYLNVANISELLDLKNFTHILSQEQIEVYNAVIGGRKDENNKQIVQGLNQHINLYNQQQKDKNARLPLLKPLYNQILGDRQGVSFLPKQFNNAQELATDIKAIYEHLCPIIAQLHSLIVQINDYDLNGIFIKNDLNLTEIAQRHYGAYDTVKRALRNEYEHEHPQKNRQKAEKYEEQISKYLKNLGSISLAHINAIVPLAQPIQDYFKSFGAVCNTTIQRENWKAYIDNAYTAIAPILNDTQLDDNTLRKNITFIKDFLDAIKQLQWFLKPLLGAGNEIDKDSQFYGTFEPLYDTLDNAITPLYDKVRSYLTKKPYSLDKFKINFDCSTLLDGWDLNKEEQNLSFLMQKDGYYYLAIMQKGSQRRVLQAISYSEAQGDCYEKMEYKQLNGTYKMFTKCFLSSDNVIKKWNCPKQIIQIYQTGSHKDNKQDLETYINFCKKHILMYPGWERYNFKFRATNAYSSITEFFQELDQQAYNIQFQQVPVSLIHQLVDDGSLYLFKIANKDFSPYSKGRPNLHTIYWKMLFDPKNLNDVVYKLNGKAEIFFRRKTQGEHTVHKAHHAIDNKSEFTKHTKPQSTFSYDIIKDHRFTIDQFEFHVSITLNFKKPNRERLNLEVREFIKDQGVRHIIGIDRGERHLLYFTMIDMDGHIVKQFSLNTPSQTIVNSHQIDYHQLLETKETNRLDARRNWNVIENIKELKQGYLSQVVHLLATEMIANDAILVLENLNAGFMRGRQKVEKSVYQKFEKMLIDKLNYIVDKSKQPNEPCGALHAVQLTTPFSDFNSNNKANVKQCGFVFYIPAWNTSKIDPVTGFVNLFDCRLTTINELKSFFSKFDRICYNQSKGWFEFAFDYSKFTTRAEGTRTQWTICTYGERIWTHRSPSQNNQFVSETIDITQEILKLLSKLAIDPNSNLKEGIANIDSKEQLEDLLHLFKLTLQMRNSVTGSEVDYLVSPIADQQGTLFDSRQADEQLPQNADANGAYNIARKGLIIARQIMQSSDVEHIRFAITNKDWLRFAQHIDD